MITVPINISSPYHSQDSDANSLGKSPKVVELFNAMRDQSKEGNGPASTNGRSVSSAAALTSLCADISPSSSHFFEVLYIGKIKVSHKKVPESFIDDALEKFRVHELEKGKCKITKQGSSLNMSATGVSTGSNGHINQSGAPGNNVVLGTCRDELQSRRGSQDSGCSGEVETADNLNMVSPTVLSPMVPSSNSKQLGDSMEAISVVSQSESNIVPRQHSQPTTPSEALPVRNNSTIGTDSTWAKQQSLPLEPMRNRAASTGSAKELKKTESTTHNDHNRTMLFQVGRIDLRLISPDRKQILLHKHLKDVASCIQGNKHADHFGFICREVNVECYIGYVFKCQSESVADDVVAAITQAFLATSEAQRREKLPVLSCEHCPMVWYHKLCTEAEGLNDKRTQATIFRRLELLPEEEQSVILTKFRGAETSSLREQNEFLMMLLRAHCEGKQARHTHDTAENRSEFLNQYLGGSTIFMKAKRSLTSSFDQLLKRKGSRDDFGPIVKELSLPMNAALCKDSPSSSGTASPTTRSSPAPTLDVPESNLTDSGANLRPRSSTVGTADAETMKRELQGKQANGLCKGSNLSASNSQQQLAAVTPTNGQQKGSPMMNIFLKVGHTSRTSPTQEPNQDVTRQPGSWRQAIFNRVVTPNKGLPGERGLGATTPKQHPLKRDREELRALWKKAINQQLLLIRMDKENARLRARQEEATVKRIKLEYDEIGSCVREVMEVWDLLVSKESRVSTQCDSKMLLQAIRQGVPRSKRGDVWHFLAEQFCLKVAPIDTTNFPNYHVPYENLLRQLTSHQHAILIDLGRTFPNHTYFSSPLGPGQLALFNLLKAYSLLDPEVGYCQGLSFVAGVLILHMTEESAFFLLRHLMFRRGLRRQYLPDMAALQVQLYQLSRLLHDQHRDLYDHFEKHEVAPTLYAAPWILTVFASQFPLGFVTRVFDLLFLENTEVLFRVALALLGEHKEGLLSCDSFEEIMEYLKNVVPQVDKKMMDRVMKQVFTMDVSKQLHEYEVEYHVLQEGMSSLRPEEVEALHKAEAANRELMQQNQALIEQLEIATSEIQRLEASRTHQQIVVSRLQSQVSSLEVSVATIGHFIESLAESNSNIEIPGEIRRVVAQLSVAERRRSNVGQTLFKSPKQDTSLLKTVSLRAMESNEDTLSSYNAANGRTHSAGSEISIKLKGSEDKPREMPYPLKSALSSPNLTTKISGMSSFFANTHNQIKQQRLNATSNPTELANNGTVAAKRLPVNSTNNSGASTTADGCKNSLPDITGYEKSNSMPLAAPRSKLKSSQSSFELRAGTTSNKIIENTQCDSSDSGNVTPTSPIMTNHIHPLDTCSDVHFTYGGTTKLKTIRPLRAHLSRNSSVDSIPMLKPVGPGGDGNIITSKLVDSKNSETSTVTPIGETKKSLITG
ncbi:TBC1 domain family member 1 isoform X2 [Periplaneta americana]|uniref:TBC1 domain family member 1 isoform X2 n=1 Tax=Periplaneta americana TaxID=6978 RepID=UPI0037E965B0